MLISKYESVSGVVESLKIITREKSMRIAEFAFAQAHSEGRKKITAVHKANIMKLGDGLFLQCCKEVSKRYPNIQFETMIVDNTCMQVKKILFKNILSKLDFKAYFKTSTI